MLLIYKLYLKHSFKVNMKLKLKKKKPRCSKFLFITKFFLLCLLCLCRSDVPEPTIESKPEDDKK